MSALADSGYGQALGIPNLPPQLADPNAKVEWVVKLASSCDAPTYEESTGAVYFTEAKGPVPQWPIWKVDTKSPGNPATVFLQESELTRGLGFDPQGRLVAAQRGKLIGLRPDGTWETLAASSAAVPLEEVNDFTFGKAGGIYFTGRDPNIYYRNGAGSVSILYNKLIRANGILYVEEKAALYVNDIEAGKLLEFPVTEQGGLGPPTEKLRVSRPDGLSMDELGNFYVSDNSNGIVHVFNPLGKEIGTVKMTATSQFPQYDVCKGGACNATHAKFGGPDGKTLYITGDGGLYSLRMKVAGRKPPRPMAIQRSPGRGVATREALFPRPALRNASGRRGIRPSGPAILFGKSRRLSLDQGPSSALAD